MKTRLFICLALFLSLPTCAHRGADECREAWTRGPDALSIPQGLGVNIHFTDPQPGEIKMIADAGVRWLRTDLKWDATEKQAGVYDFSAYDRLMATLGPYRIRPLFILDYGNSLYDNGAPPRSESARQAFARWAVAAAKHFAGRGALWEIYNEPNHKQFWPPAPNVNEYVALALAVCQAFRREVPNEKLIGPATSTIDFDFLESCFKAHLLEYWSAVSVHPYRQTNPETVAAEYCQLRKLIQTYQSPGRNAVPVLSGEWGYSSAWRDLSEQKQSELFAREMLTNATNDIQISIWYDWRDDGPDPNEAEHHFGLVRNIYHSGDQPYDPKPAYLAAATLSSLFAGYSFDKRIVVPNSDDYVLVFSKGSDERIAVWTTSTNHRLIVPVVGASYLAIKSTGERLSDLSSDPKGIALNISTAPIYLRRRD